MARNQVAKPVAAIYCANVEKGGALFASAYESQQQRYDDL